MHDLSVVMATYNENPIFLKACIDSILNQTFRNFEFIIAAEPQEKNMEFLSGVESADKRVKILRNETRLGVASSRNRAIMESSGKYIALMDGDDYCALDRFEKQLSFLEDNPDVSVVGSNLYLIDEDDNIIGERKYPEFHSKIKRSFLLTMAVANPSVIFRKKDIDEVGLFDDRLYKAEDFELWFRFLANNKIMHNLQENLVYYRIQDNSNKKRGTLHFRNVYISRKRYSKLIWPLHIRFLSLFLFFLVSRIPNVFLDYLLNLRIVNRMKNIKSSRA
ncbi:MAG: glycosyltransferase [Thermodesulfovibrionales bacterium]|nr:glycosyltransferase [Thermodesulfovibrionales bacterium]